MGGLGDVGEAGQLPAGRALHPPDEGGEVGVDARREATGGAEAHDAELAASAGQVEPERASAVAAAGVGLLEAVRLAVAGAHLPGGSGQRVLVGGEPGRSEEQTSELQSLLRI